MARGGGEVLGKDEEALKKGLTGKEPREKVSLSGNRRLPGGNL